MAVTELYVVQIHQAIWRFTSSHLDVMYQNELFKSVTISRDSSIEQSSDPLRGNTSFSVMAGTKLAELALNPPLNVAPKMTILRSENGIEYLTVFAGRMMAGKWDDGFVSVELEPLHTELQVTGLNETVTHLCRYSLGSRKCGRQLSAVTARVKSIQGDVITLESPLPASSSYSFGRLQHEQSFYYIDTQLNQTQLKLLHLPEFKVRAGVSIVEGCDRTLQTCHSRFNNAINFGGAVNLPLKNPYTGDPIDR
ncbi:phage BR0599 family protein [Vibrio mimicus]